MYSVYNVCADERELKKDKKTHKHKGRDQRVSENVRISFSISLLFSYPGGTFRLKGEIKYSQQFKRLNRSRAENKFRLD